MALFLFIGTLYLWHAPPTFTAALENPWIHYLQHFSFFITAIFFWWPIIGPAPRHSNLWLAFGHSHMGFTLGPISGLLIANFVDGSEQPFAVAACDPARWL